MSTSSNFTVDQPPSFTYNMSMMNKQITNEYHYQEHGEWKTNTVTVPAIGGIKWHKRESTGEYKQSAYYDHSFYKVPFYGPCDLSRIRNALNKLYPARFNKFGGYSTVSAVEKLDDEHIKVEMCYHIGD
jgi:hypothetical protein